MPYNKKAISQIMFKFGIVVYIAMIYIPVHHSASIDPSPLIRYFSSVISVSGDYVRNRYFFIVQTLPTNEAWFTNDLPTLSRWKLKGQGHSSLKKLLAGKRFRSIFRTLLDVRHSNFACLHTLMSRGPMHYCILWMRQVLHPPQKCRFWTQFT